LKGGGSGTNKNIAAETGLSAAYITNLKKNQRGDPSMSVMIKIANALGYDIIEFLELGRELLEGKKPAEQPQQSSSASETLMRAAEAFCTILYMDEEKRKKKAG
jgi:transcriptional regulator with XRE-family HTH domain